MYFWKRSYLLRLIVELLEPIVFSVYLSSIIINDHASLFFNDFFKDQLLQRKLRSIFIIRHVQYLVHLSYLLHSFAEDYYYITNCQLVHLSAEHSHLNEVLIEVRFAFNALEIVLESLV